MESKTDSNIWQLDSKAVDFLTGFNFSIDQPAFIPATTVQNYSVGSSSVVSLPMPVLIVSVARLVLDYLCDLQGPKAESQMQEARILAEDGEKKSKRGRKRKTEDSTVRKRVSKSRNLKEAPKSVTAKNGQENGERSCHV